ncbi:efflux RND transporter permease subunit [Brucella intermedia]|uniref:efflux RND transporter permease subunit n=1 Tax=Brucella intermedia TaxID=94625 RepID=UPI00124C8CCE|nr:efflux RND transporter permease subunit [Brucella intermedia]KAB2722393.1 efflux RND transporter permease subunit [Brucella intermedia]
MRFNLSEWAVRERQLVVFLIAIVLGAGIFAYTRLGRAEDPSFVIKTMVVQAAWPGANVEDTLKQVTERLERTLQETPHLDNIRSFTRPGVTTIFVNLEGSASAAQVKETWYLVRKRVADMRHTLPLGVVGPGFNDEFGDTFGLIYGFTAADGFTHRELRDYVEAARSRLLEVPDVAKIELIGEQPEQIFVEFSMQELANLGADRASLIAALRAQNIVQPSGTILTGNENLSIDVSGAFKTEQDIANINFAVNGRMVRLADIATVRRGYADPPAPLFRVNGVPAIGLAISMREGGDILRLGRNIDEAMFRIKGDLPLGIEPHLVADQAVTVRGAISEFMESLWQAIAIILAVSFFALGVRAGLMVAFTIPLTLAGVFAVMWLVDIDMQRISLGALIIALALMVDDAMTTTDATLGRLAAGEPKETAAVYAFKTYAFAMLAGTLVTIAGFVPVGFAASSAGEYTFTLFAVVSIALLISWFVAVLFAPLIGLYVLKPPKHASVEPGRVMRAYRRFLLLALTGRWLTVAITLVLFLVSLFLLPLIPRQFFPASDRPELLVDLELPQNSSIFATERAMERLDAALKKDPDVARWSGYVGRGAIRFYLPLDARLPNDFFGQAVVVARNVDARLRLQEKLVKLLADEFPEVVSRVSPLELGPPVGWPIQYRVLGPELSRVRDIAYQLAEVIAKNPLTKTVNYEWVEPAREVRVHIDQDKARLLGLSTEAVGRILNTIVTGTPVTQVRDDIYLINVLLRATDEERISLDTLRTVQVPLPGGRTVPLSQFASFDFEQTFPLVWRRNRIPSLTVQSDIEEGTLPETVVQKLAPDIEALTASLPSGYRIETGGTVEESAASLASVIAVVPVMILMMLIVLMFQLRRFSLTLLVVSVAPLGLIGVVLALLGSNRPLGFVAILGVLALIGMIIKNAVILIGQIEAERSSGKAIKDAVLDASSARFTPIMLTAVSTVLGMIPIAPTVFWGPMAFAIMGGLLVATLLTLIFLPALYVCVIREKAKESVLNLPGQ